jgi:serine/threonine protein kinase
MSVNFSNQFQGLSGDAKNVIIQLLQREPNNRIAAKHLLHHQWLVKPNDKSSIDMTRLKE